MNLKIQKLVGLSSSWILTKHMIELIVIFERKYFIEKGLI